MPVGKKKIIKRLITATVSILIALIAVVICSFFLIETEYASKKITSYLNDSEKNIYSIYFSKIAINPFKQSISFRDLEINQVIDNKQASNLEIKTNTLKLSGISIQQYLKNDALVIKQITLKKPLINYNQQQNKNKATNQTELIKKLGPLIYQTFTSISIDKIEIIDAGFLEHQHLREAKQETNTIRFDIGIEKFYADSLTLTDTDDFFEARDIYLKIEDYQEIIGDSIHQLEIEELIYSIKNKSIQASNLNLAPINSTISTATKYWLNVPQLKIHSSKVEEIFQNDSITIDSLELMNANIKVIPPANAKGMNLKEIGEYDLYQLAKDEFKQLNIKKLKLSANELSIIREDDLHNSKQDFTNLYVELEGFQLDSGSYTNNQKILYSDDVRIKVENYLLKLNDQVHQFSSRNILACSKSSSLMADKIKMFPYNPSNKHTTQVNLECDSIRLSDVDLSKLFHYREMPLQHVAAYKPSIKLLIYDKQKIQKQHSNSLLYHFIGNYIKGIYSNLVTIHDGNFVIQDYKSKTDTGQIATNFDFRLTDFSLDSISANKTDKLFFATNFELKFQNYTMNLLDKLHHMSVEQISVSSLHKKARIKNLHLFPKEKGNSKRILKKYNKSELYEIKIPYLHLHNTNFHQAFFDKKLKINNFSIIEPSIYFELLSRKNKPKEKFDFSEFYKLINNYIIDTHISKIKLSNGKFKLVNHDRRNKTISFDNKFNLELNNFRLNDHELSKNRLLFSDDFRLILKDYLFKLSDEVHYVQAKEIGISTFDSEVFIKNAILYPDITSVSFQKLPQHLHVNLPNFKLEGINLEEAYHTRRLSVNRLSLLKPEIKIYQSEKRSTKKLNIKNLTIPLPTIVHELKVNTFELIDGKLEIIKSHQQQDNKIASLNIHQVSKQILINRTQNLKFAHIEAKSFNTNLSNIEFTPINGNLHFKLAKLDYSQQNKVIKIKDLFVSKRSTSEQTGFLSASFPSLQFSGINNKETKRQDCVRAKLIEASNAKFHFSKPSTKNKLPNLYQLKLGEDFLSLVDEISADKIKLTNAKIVLDKNGKQHQLDHIQLNLQNFNISKDPSSNLLSSEDIEFTLKNFKRRDKDNLYEFIFDEIKLSTKSSTFSINGIKINPLYSRDAFQNVIPFQQDYFKGQMESIKIEKLDIKRYLELKELTAKRLLISHFNLDIYRDMRKIFNEKQRPLMPQDLIRKLEVPFFFDSIAVSSSSVQYSEQLKERPEPGTINFHNINATLSPFTNIEYIIQQQPISNLKADASLMSRAQLQVQMNFNMQKHDNPFHVSGSIAPFQMSALNPMTQNAAQIGIRSGKVNRFDFNFDANSIESNGKLRFAYDDLKINILSQKNGNTKESKFASFLANSLMIKSKNPRTKILLPDAIHFKRDEKRSILNYWWKSIFSGIKNTFGIKEKKKSDLKKNQ